MKTKLSLAIFLCLLMTHRFTAQTCNQPPSCIQNGGLTGPTAAGDINTSPATTVPNWFASHGTPTYFGPSNQVIWMWSYQNRGEGIYTCYNFTQGRQYRVCVSARYSGTTNTGNMLISANSGLNFSGSTTLPVPLTNQTIANANITNTTMTIYTYVFTANNNFNQLWIRPLFAGGGALPPINQYYAIEVDNIHVEDLSLPDPNFVITPSGPMVNNVPVNLTVSGGPIGTTYNWLGGPTGSVKTVTPYCAGISTGVTANYNWCPTPQGVTICTRTKFVPFNLVATEGCCCQGWGMVGYDDHTNPQFPVARIGQCGMTIKMRCGYLNRFYFNYNCGPRCAQSFNATLHAPGGALVYSNIGSGSAGYQISGLPLVGNGIYTLTVASNCGANCGTCVFYLDVTCPRDRGVDETPSAYSIVPNPAGNTTTIVANDEPVLSYILKDQFGTLVLSKTGLHEKEVAMDLSTLQKGIYTLIVNDSYNYKLLKE